MNHDVFNMMTLSPKVSVDPSHQTAQDPLGILKVGESIATIIYTPKSAHALRDHIEICGLAMASMKRGQINEEAYNNIEQSTYWWKTEGLAMQQDYHPMMREEIAKHAALLGKYEVFTPAQNLVHETIRVDNSTVSFARNDVQSITFPDTDSALKFKDFFVLATNYGFERANKVGDDIQFNTAIQQTGMAVKPEYQDTLGQTQTFLWQAYQNLAKETGLDLSKDLSAYYGNLHTEQLQPQP